MTSPLTASTSQASLRKIRRPTLDGRGVLQHRPHLLHGRADLAYWHSARPLLRSHTSAPMVHAWMLVFAGLGFLLVGLAIYHAKFLPTGGEERRTESVAAAAATSGTCWLPLPEAKGHPSSRLHLFVPSRRRPGNQGRSTLSAGRSRHRRPSAFRSSHSAQFTELSQGFLHPWQRSRRIPHARLGLKRALFPLICVMNFPMSNT